MKSLVFNAGGSSALPLCWKPCSVSSLKDKKEHLASKTSPPGSLSALTPGGEAGTAKERPNLGSPKSAADVPKPYTRQEPGLAAPQIFLQMTTQSHEFPIWPLSEHKSLTPTAPQIYQLLELSFL